MKKLLKSMVFVLCACLCACVFVACDDDKTGGGETVSRSWKQILESDDMKTVTVEITSAMNRGEVSAESKNEYKRDGDKYVCKGEYVDYVTGNKTVVTDYYERVGDKMYIYHTAPDEKVYKSEIDEEGRYEFDYGSNSGNDLSIPFSNIKTVEGLIAKAIAEESKFDAGTDEDGAKAYKCEGDMMGFYLSMAPDSAGEAPAGVTITGNLKIFVKNDKVEKIIFDATMKSGKIEQHSTLSFVFAYATGSITLPTVTPAE